MPVKPTDFSMHLTAFLSDYLPIQKNVSRNTIKSYRDTFKLLLLFCEKEESLPAEKITMKKLSSDLVGRFLNWLETERKSSVSTRNLRLTAIHSFFRYVSTQDPEYLFVSQQILAIPEKKKEQKPVKHFETDQVRELLASPDTHTSHGRRDQALLCLLYDSGCRVQELADIKVCDIRLTAPAQVTVTGKGRKTRTIPLTDETKEILTFYIKENLLMHPSKQDTPLFYNCHGNKLTRQGITYILKKYTEPLGLEGATPHILRHSKAMHMTEADINPIYIRDFLGHTDLKVTQIYSKTSVEMKRRALEKLKGSNVIPEKPQKDWTNDKNLMDWLNNLGR